MKAVRACSKNNRSGFPRNLLPLIITLLRQALSLARTLSSSQVSWARDHTPPYENRINPSSAKGNLGSFIANQKIQFNSLFYTIEGIYKLHTSSRTTKIDDE